ncbi:MAG: hypothetical protein K6D94_11775 [Clostridiales bacterium]|nr:hypothetical protein [Clostridiales bacterium]
MKTEIKNINGVPHAVIDGQVMGRLAFKTFRASDYNIVKFSGAGVRLFNVLTGAIKCMLGVPYSLFGETWVGDGEYDMSPIDRQMELFLKNAPDGYFSVMVQLDTRPWYCEKHHVAYSFEALSQVIADREWRKAADGYLRAVISHCEERYGDRIFGYFLLCGFTTEWFSEHDYEEPSDSKTAAYREYLGDSGAVIPPKEIRETPKDVVYLDPGRDGELISYRRFHSELISEAICSYAATVKEMTNRGKLCGVYYGYLYELGGARLWNAGCLDYGRVFGCPDIDMISSPSSYSYGQRTPDGASGVMLPCASVSGRDKLYFLEFDQRTFTVPPMVDGSNGVPLPGWDSRLPDERSTIDVMRRDLMLCATQKLSLWWFDMFGGWFDSNGVTAEIASQVRLMERISALPGDSAAEIAVISEGGESLYRVNKNSGLNAANISRQIVEITKAGAPADLYSAFDLPDTDMSRYKLVIFTDAYAVSDEAREIIKRLAEEGKTLIFLGAAGIAAELGIGFRIEKRVVDIAWNGFRFGTGEYQDAVVTEDCGEVLAQYEDGAPAAVRKGNVILAASGPLPKEMIRQIAKEAGVFFYSEERPVYVNESLIGVYLEDGRGTSLRVREDGEYEELFGGKTLTAAGGVIEVPFEGSRAALLTRKTK